MLALMSKAQLDVAVRPSGEAWSVPHDRWDRHPRGPASKLWSPLSLSWKPPGAEMPLAGALAEEAFPWLS